MQILPPYDKIGVTPAPLFQNANPAAGVSGSIVNAEVFNALQAEITNAQAGANLTQNPNDYTQLLQAIRSGLLGYYVDNGSVNEPAIAPANPAISALVDGLHFRIKMKTAPTGAVELFVNSLSAPLERRGFAACIGGEWDAGDFVDVTYSATANAFQIDGITVNDVTGTGSGGGTPPSAGEGIEVTGYEVALNYPGLTEEDTINASDLLAFYAEESEGGQPASHHYKTTFSSFASAVLARSSASANVQIFTTSGTYTPTAGAKVAYALVTGGGGAGGGSNGARLCCGQGGQAGATAFAFFQITGPLAVTVGAGGVPSAAAAASGTQAGAGTASALGGLATAPGGVGGLNSMSNSSLPAQATGGTGTLVMPGNPGEGVIGVADTPSSSPYDDNGMRGGHGGASFWGGAGVGVDANPGPIPANGGNGAGFGSGGGGADSGMSSATQGGYGAQGVVVILEM